jgi:methionyl-tRNA formyltransferase
LRVAFLGNDRWSVPPLEALASSQHDIVLVATRTPRPGRRGGADVPTPVAEAARRLGVPVAEVETVKRGRGLDAVAGVRPDVLAVVAYGEILPREILALPALAPVNVHYSLLPELRGAAPVQRAILAGLIATGVTTLVMDEGLDTGPILLQATEPIHEDDDARTLGDRLAAVGGRLLVDTLDRLSSGTIEPLPQDPARATLAPKIARQERWLDWTESAGEILRRVRALAPRPAASTLFRGGTLKVQRAAREGGTSREAEPGVVLVADSSGVVVGAGEGAVRLLEVAPAGRGRMGGSEFVRGYRPKVGERLG